MTTSYDEASAWFDDPNFPEKEGYTRQGNGIYVPSYHDEEARTTYMFQSESERDKFIKELNTIKTRRLYGYEYE